MGTPELSTESTKLLRLTTATSNTYTNGKLAASTTRTSRTLPNPMISALTRHSSDGRSMISAPSPTTCRPLPSDSPDLSPVSSTSATTSPQTAQAKQQAAPKLRKEDQCRSRLLEIRTFDTFKRKLNASCLLTKMYFYFCSTIPCIKNTKNFNKNGLVPNLIEKKKKKKKKKS